MTIFQKGRKTIPVAARPSHRRVARRTGKQQARNAISHQEQGTNAQRARVLGWSSDPRGHSRILRLRSRYFLG